MNDALVVWTSTQVQFGLVLMEAIYAVEAILAHNSPVGVGRKAMDERLILVRYNGCLLHFLRWGKLGGVY